MATRKKYRLKKKIKNFLIFYTIVCTLFVASYTLSRYVGTTTVTNGIDIAKFNVSVNDIDVKDGTPIKFNFNDSKTFAKGKIAPNSRGYFEFIINPDGTEVSIEYEIKFMLDELDEDFKLEYFTVNDSETHYAITDENIVKNNLLLSSKESGTTTGFTNADKISIKIYWLWDEQDEIRNSQKDIYENKKMDVMVIVRQKIN